MARSGMTIIIFCMLFLLSAPVFAGSFSSTEHRFDLSWSDDWVQSDEKTRPQTIVNLHRENNNFQFQVAVENFETDKLGENFLRSEKCVEGLYNNTGKKKSLFDQMTTISKYPARKVIFLTRQGFLVGFTGVLAGDKYYMLVMVRTNDDYKFFKREYESMLSNFSIKGNFGSDF